MLRFILRRKTRDEYNGGFEHESFETIEINVPELESLLTRGGSGPSGYDATSLVGIEVSPEWMKKSGKEEPYAS